MMSIAAYKVKLHGVAGNETRLSGRMATDGGADLMRGAIL